MSDDPRQDQRQSAESSTRPKDHVSEISTPVGLCSDAHALYGAVAEDFDGRPLENIRLTFRVPPEHKSEGCWKKRRGWVIHCCEVTGHRFAVPSEAPVPILAADKPRCDGEGTWLRSRIVHPDLLYDRPKLLRMLARELDLEIHDRLHDLCEAFSYLDALSRMDRLPDDGVDDPYLTCRNGRRGYAAVGSGRPR